MTEEKFRELYGDNLANYAIQLYGMPKWDRFHEMFVNMGWMHNNRALTPIEKGRGGCLDNLVRPGPSDYFLAIQNPNEYYASNVLT
jgi:hypothetical protein